MTDEADHLRRRLEQAFLAETRAVHRIGGAGTSVTFNIEGSGKVTVLMDRRPPVVAGDGEPAEITIDLNPEQAEQFARGELLLPNALLRGEVSARGPIRKYLTMDPIIRAILEQPE